MDSNQSNTDTPPKLKVPKSIPRTSENLETPPRTNRRSVNLNSDDIPPNLLETSAIPFRRSNRSSSAGSTGMFGGSNGSVVSLALVDSVEMRTRQPSEQSKSDQLAAPVGARYRTSSSRSARSGFGILNKKPSVETDGEFASDTDYDSVTGEGRVWRMKESAREKKNIELHKLFRSLSAAEIYIADFQCALQKDILIQGKLYLTPNNICFYANIFGFVTTLVIPFAEIINLEKKMTALIIPNAIAVSTTKTQYIFTSFMSREQCFAVIDELWRANSTLTPDDFDFNDPPPDSDSESADAGEDLDDSSFDENSIIANHIPVSLDGITLTTNDSANSNIFSNDPIFVFLNDFISPLVAAESDAVTFADAPLTWLTGITTEEVSEKRVKGKKGKVSSVQSQQQMTGLIVVVVFVVLILLTAVSSLSVLWKVRRIVGKIEDLVGL
ncbi:hypothetical protein HK096_006571, partial [Nowakowskiella sp. JEL0078]